MDKIYNEIAEDFREISNLESISSQLSWDNAVMMPKNGITRRSKEITLINKIIHNSYNKKNYMDMIGSINFENLDQWQQANIRSIKHILSHNVIIPEQLNNNFIESGINCEYIWRSAKSSNDFNSFAKALTPVINYLREIALIKSEEFSSSKYDALLDYYEPGLKEDDFKPIFQNLAKTLPNLIDQVIRKQGKKTDFSSLKFPIEKQKLIVKRFTQLLGLSSDDIRIDESAHPFCTGSLGDVRITTRYSEAEFLTSLFGIIHESGHAIYDLNTPKQFQFDPVGGCLGMAIHESQSLFYEMQIATSRDFIEIAHKIISKEFNIKNSIFTADNLFKFLNHVEKKYIRVDSDEITYPLHIIMRYEIEKKLINGEIEVNDLPEIWEYYLKNFFDLDYQNHSNGCMQDIHWTDGSIGYFPCYSLGAIIASQLKHKFDQENPNFKLAENNISKFQEFLTDNVHKYGRLKDASSLSTFLFDSKYDDKIYVNYLNKKYLNE
ncbi:MAG: carboxypeptidase M32 [Rickettsiales bacterium]|nr:carboxypeptidase M32 [Rickettsiales bacterium]